MVKNHSPSDSGNPYVMGNPGNQAAATSGRATILKKAVKARTLRVKAKPSLVCSLASFTAVDLFVNAASISSFLC